LENKRLLQQSAFLLELDKLKTIFRRSFLASAPSRCENDAEHSWYISIMAIVLQEYCASEINVSRVIGMLLVHDVVEIDAGDISVFHNPNPEAKFEKEEKATHRLFGMLPEDQYLQLLKLWHEFEDGVTPESRYARIMDRMEPLLQNYYTQGKRWQEDKITLDQVINVNRIIEDVSPQLWEYAQLLISDSLARGYLKKSY
jgi:putative hydrolase of HD superfamily